MDQQLINKVYNKLKQNKRNTHHIILQVHTALDLFTRTGKGKEILEHYLEHHVRYLDRVFYYNGRVYDFNNLKITRYSRANRNNEWVTVEKYYGNKYTKRF